MVNIHMRYQWSRSSLLSRFTSITKITLKKKQQTSQSKFTLSTFYCDFLLFRSAVCPKHTKHSAIFTEKWKTFQGRLTLGPTSPGSPSSPCKPGGPYILTKIFVSSVKGESKSKGGAGVRERERGHSPPIIVARVEIQAQTPLSKREGDWRRHAPRKCLWDRYQGRAGQLLAISFSVPGNSPRSLCESSLGPVSLPYVG